MVATPGDPTASTGLAEGCTGEGKGEEENITDNH